MPGGLMDDPDMRYGFAIDRLFSKRKISNVKRCACGGPMGICEGSHGPTRCVACRNERAQSTSPVRDEP
jgi:hypothetical protein